MHLSSIDKVAIPLNQAIFDHSVNGSGQRRAISSAEGGDLSHRSPVKPTQGGEDLPLIERKAHLDQFKTEGGLALPDDVVEQEEQVAGRQGFERVRRPPCPIFRLRARHFD
nr:hypothetical protein [Brevundimonas sp. UBA2416]